MDDDTISVLLPVHSGIAARHLRECLESLVDQTRPADEIVIVEDGPLGQEQRKELTLFTSRGSNIRTVRLARNQGAGAANQAGLEVASGTWIAKADADDINSPSRFAESLHTAIDLRCDLIGAAMAEFDGDLTRILATRTNPRDHDAIRSRMRINNPINHPTAFYRREVALAAGGYKSEMRFMQDYDMFARMLISGARMYNMPQSLVFFRATPAMLRRRRSLRMFRCELLLQRNLRRYGVIATATMIRNLVVRSGIRVAPPVLLRTLYRAVYYRKSL